MTPLDYVPLQKPRESRLINIRCGATTDPLSLELPHLILDETNPPAFEALSCRWGSLEDTAAAEVVVRTGDGTSAASHVSSIGRNLAVALAHLRRPSEAGLVWAGPTTPSASTRRISESGRGRC